MTLKTCGLYTEYGVQFNITFSKVKTMEIQEFYNELRALPRSFQWNVDDGQIVGQRSSGAGSGSELNPVTALAAYKLKKVYGPTKRDMNRAGRELGLSRDFVDHVHNACVIHSNNRGFTQIVRGKLRAALEV